MKMLSFDTATPFCTVALQVEEKKYFLQQTEKQQGKIILFFIHQLLQQAGIQITDLDAIAFGRGPGSFTGMRLAAAIVQGLACDTNIPIIGFSTLNLLAQSAWLQWHDTEISICVDARMQKIYLGNYVIKNNLMTASQVDEVIAVTELAKRIREQSIIMIDNQNLLPENSFIKNIRPLYLAPQALLDLANYIYQKKQFLPLQQALPNYLLTPDFKIS